MIKFNKDQNYWASAYITNEFLCIETCSGLGMTGSNHLFPPRLLLPDVDDKTIGEDILKALSDSHTLTELADRVKFFDLEKGKEQYAAWKTMLREKYGYKTKRVLFKDMKNCGIHCVNSVITISPTRHEKLEGWGRTKGDGIKDVILSVDNSPDEIGAALRLALSRCKG